MIIYSYHTSANISDGNNQEIPYPKCIILSLKTSLRERASQTYKWKLLWFFGLCYAMDWDYKGWNPYIERYLAIFVNCFCSRAN
ncbi:hypothetical protein MICAE_1030037 [Microcystis aeruginosa PCC 9806]|uniref:BsaWI restriction endonuclease type 2 domain-containing protein n=1 Tax=Microcystis aeruginosa PCC 9806 TaxID=1160282 RepID=I4GQF9_MICAE|nr:hypothetical protein MICAE_1030037 [Microcystis aeruginosa PCC 9806]